MVVVKSDKIREKASVEFLKWFTDKDRNIRFCIESGYMPVKREANNIEIIKEYMTNSKNSRFTERLKTHFQRW